MDKDHLKRVTLAQQSDIEMTEEARATLLHRISINSITLCIYPLFGTNILWKTVSVFAGKHVIYNSTVVAKNRKQSGF